MVQKRQPKTELIVSNHTRKLGGHPRSAFPSLGSRESSKALYVVYQVRHKVHRTELYLTPVRLVESGVEVRLDRKAARVESKSDVQ